MTKSQFGPKSFEISCEAADKDPKHPVKLTCEICNDTFTATHREPFCKKPSCIDEFMGEYNETIYQ